MCFDFDLKVNCDYFSRRKSEAKQDSNECRRHFTLVSACLVKGLSELRSSWTCSLEVVFSDLPPTGVVTRSRVVSVLNLLVYASHGSGASETQVNRNDEFSEFTRFATRSNR